MLVWTGNYVENCKPAQTYSIDVVLEAAPITVVAFAAISGIFFGFAAEFQGGFGAVAASYAAYAGIVEVDGVRTWIDPPGAASPSFSGNAQTLTYGWAISGGMPNGSSQVTVSFVVLSA